MIQYANYSEIQEIYIRPKDQYSSRVINKLTKIVAPKGKGIIEGLDVEYSTTDHNVIIKKGIVVADETVIEFTADISFNLFTELENKYMYDEDGNQIYRTLDEAIQANNISRIFLIVNYERDLNNPTKPAVFDLIKAEDFDINNSKTVLLYFWDLSVISSGEIRDYETAETLPI